MLQCRESNASVFTVAVFLFTQPFDQKSFAVIRLTGLSAFPEMAESVNQKTANDADYDFYEQNSQNTCHGTRL